MLSGMRYRHPKSLRAESMPMTVSATVAGNLLFSGANFSSSGPTNPSGKTPQVMANIPAWERRVVERTHHLLQRLDKDRRRVALSSKLTQRQRLVLELWMRAQRTVSCGQSVVKEALTVSCASNANQQVQHSPQCISACANSLTKKVSKRMRGEGQSQRAGVATHRKAETYSAVMSVWSLEVRSRQVSDKDVATRLRQAFLEAKEILTSEPSATPAEVLGQDQAVPDTGALAAELMARLPSTVLQCLRKHRLDDSEMEGMYMRATLRRSWFGVSLCGPAFHFGKEFQAGISGWQRLRSAEEGESDEAWSAVRGTYLDLWGRVGRATAPLAMKLDALERRHACREKMRHFTQRKQALKQQRQERAAGIANRKAAKEDACAKRNEATLVKVLALWDAHFRKRSIKAAARLEGFTWHAMDVTQHI